MADTPRWKIVVDGNEYIFDPFRDLTIVTLRHIKQWYGPELGRLGPFVIAFGQGDPDAIACAIWAVRRKAGEVGVPEPRQIDAEVGTFMTDMEQLVEPDPTEEAPEPAATTPGSTATSTSSETDTSDSSPTFATSPPET